MTPQIQALVAVDLVLVEQARRAFERGDGWFEAEIERRGAGGVTPRAFPATDLLSRIENEGWSLHTAQYVYVQLGEETQEKWFSSSQQVAIKGEIVGMYLFRSA